MEIKVNLCAVQMIHLVASILLMMFCLAPTQGMDLQGECRRPADGSWVCRVCGKKNPKGASFCWNDGQDLRKQRAQFLEKLKPFFAAKRTRIVRGEAVELDWYSYCGQEVRIEPDIGPVPSSGALKLHPSATSSFKLVVDSPWPIEQVAPIEVVVVPLRPEASLRAEPETVWVGGSTTLRWQTHNAQRALLEPGFGAVSSSGETRVEHLQERRTYRLTAEGEEGTLPASAQVTVQVKPLPLPPPAPVLPNYTEPFNQNAVRIYFGGGRPKLSTGEVMKLYQFASFLKANPEIHFVVFGRTKDSNKSFEAQQRALLVAQWLMRAGIDGNRMGESVNIWVLNKEEAKSKQEQRSVVFNFAGVPPLLRANVFPGRPLQAGESAQLVWSSAGADAVEITLDGIPRVFPASGRLELAQEQTTTYDILARNRFGVAWGPPIRVAVIPRSQEKPASYDPALTFFDNIQDVFFRRGSDELEPAAEDLLERNGKWLVEPRNLGVRILLEGYTDGLERKTRTARQQLANRRAQRVKSRLESLGVEAWRIRTTTKASQPFAEFDAIQARAAWQAFNRRVHFVLAGVDR